tara:strand:- start:1196 stop:2323 length:1128 start_codon:yes stop_codon:yes gene_type:complete
MNLKKWHKLVETSKFDLSSFKLRDSLNPEIWMTDEALRPDIREKLIEIAQDFFDLLELKGVDLLDITITGSLANYNWSVYSDIDLHLIIDYKQVNKDVDLVRKFLDAKRVLWNQVHDIRIHGFEVETYLQDNNEAHHSTGVYSVTDDDWTVKPEKESMDVDWKTVEKKAEFITQMIDEVEDAFNTGEYEEAYNLSIKLKEKIKKLRQTGLDKSGINSPENLAFKALRRGEHLSKLHSLKISSYDKMMSMGSEPFKVDVQENWKKFLNEKTLSKDLDASKRVYEVFIRVGIGQEYQKGEIYSAFRSVPGITTVEPVIGSGQLGTQSSFITLAVKFCCHPPANVSSIAYVNNMIKPAIKRIEGMNLVRIVGTPERVY